MSLDAFNDVLSYLVYILSIISIVGAFLTIVTFSVFKDIRTYPIRLIVYLSCSILLAQVWFMLTFSLYDTFMCIPCAIMIHYFFLADFCWCFCVAYNFYQLIVSRNREAEYYEKYYHMISWGVPALFVIGVGGSDQYGDIGSACYITSSLANFLGFFLIALIITTANAVIFFFISREIHTTVGNSPLHDKRDRVKELRVYISIFVSIGLSWMFGFIMSLMRPDSYERLVFLVLYSVSAALQGFFIFLCYCVNFKVISRWSKHLGKRVPFFKRWENLGTTLSTKEGTASSNFNSASK